MRGPCISGEFADKYLAIDLAGLTCALPVLQIRELLHLRPLLPIPHSPPFLRGALVLRGRHLPVIDLRTRFALPAALTDRSCLVVVSLLVAVDSILEFALVVDAVADVVSLAGGTVKPVADSHPILDRDALFGEVTLGERTFILLDLGRLFPPAVAADLARQASAVAAATVSP